MTLHDSLIPRASRPVINVRRFQLELDEKTPRYWLAGNPWATHLLNAMSCVFPGGERFFMTSVLAYLPDVKDPELKREVRQFCGQEAVHGQQHQTLNDWLERYELGTKALTEEIEASIKEMNEKHLSPIMRLSQTAGLEHITAILGAALLRSRTLLGCIAPEVRPLWIWHALEEIEHKAVAFDVLQSVGGSYFQRILGFATGSVALVLRTTFVMLTLLWRDGQLFNVKAALGLARLLLRSGIASDLASGYLQYFRRDFHPWRMDDRQLMAQAVKDISPYVKGSGREQALDVSRGADVVPIDGLAPAAGA